MLKANRQFKDRLFRLIFGLEEYRENALSLYNAVNHTSYTDASKLIFTTLDNAVYLGMKNDVSFLFGSDMNLYEQQSTYNPNMGLRGLLYFSHLYSSYVEREALNLYSGRPLKLPAPRFIVFYNGREKRPARKEIRLSDLFEPAGEGAVEVVAKMININYNEGAEILKRCEPLMAYAQLVQEVRDRAAAGMTLDEAVSGGVDSCIEKGVLKEILLKHKSEVVDMILEEYDEEKVRDMFRKEYLEEGREEGLKAGRTNRDIELAHRYRDRGMDTATIADLLGLTEEQVETYLAQPAEA